MASPPPEGAPQTPPPSNRRRQPRTPQRSLLSTDEIATPGSPWGVTPKSDRSRRDPFGPDPSRPPRPPRNRTTGGGGGVRRQATASRALLTPRPERPDPDLKAQLEASGIEVYDPGELEYERSVACSNLLYRFSRPTYVVRPSTHFQVSTIVTEAIARKIPLTIKNGGHSYIGSSFPNEGIMLDMKNMNHVHFDSEALTMTIQGGALWGNVYRVLVDSEDGYMVNGGRCPTVGVSGFLLGGGIGPFSRQYGLGCDNVLEMTVAAADGEIYIVTPADDPDSEEGQLFWALCGAGGANFGVVCEIKIQVFRLGDRDPNENPELNQIVAGRHTWFPTIDRISGLAGFFGALAPRADTSDGTGLLATMNQFYTTAWPKQMTIDSSWYSDLAVRNGDIAVRFLTYFDGDQKQFDKLINKNILNMELSKQLQRRSLAENSSRFLHETLFAQWDEEVKRSTPASSSFRIFHSFCFTNKLEDITKITAIIKEELEAFKNVFAGEEYGLCQCTWIHSGGQMSARARDETAFRWRDTAYHVYIQVQWRDKWMERDMRGFAHKFKNRLRPFSIAGKASFVNFPDASIPKVDVPKAYYGNNRDRLALVKRLWDPNNFFDWEQGLIAADNESEDVQARAARSSRTMEDELSDASEGDPDDMVDKMAAQHWEERATQAYDPLLTVVNDPIQMNLLYGGEWNTNVRPDLG
ncbi:hypothetical protein KVR01_007170 [Diaporthe batatas]|uniref:uncharacterized protein n=1 Tax=Diaporthe batatas TaxID=748121 RepID=UPI001D04A2DD|nr:uncharacterized protein KVR01_007170 [Diaporthe batatas]KAG8162692.1 hypothetical protein KVR01_007170 [Diaporthe batatas]